jgi:hypothetical protein
MREWDGEEVREGEEGADFCGGGKMLFLGDVLDLKHELGIVVVVVAVVDLLPFPPPFNVPPPPPPPPPVVPCITSHLNPFNSFSLFSASASSTPTLLSRMAFSSACFWVRVVR